MPTLKELGYDFLTGRLWLWWDHQNCHPDVVRKLETAFAEGVETPEFKQAVEKLYLTPRHYESKEYEQHLKEKWVRTEKMFKETGIIKEAATEPY